jgi:uroporphyrinogen decarboxylase
VSSYSPGKRILITGLKPMTITSLERVKKAIAHEPTDRVPVGPFTGYYAARIADTTIGRYVTDPRVIADAQYRLWELAGHDMVITAGDTYYMAEAFGVEVDHHEAALPTSRGPVLRSLADARRLGVPDPQRAGRMPVYVEAAAALSRRLGDRVAIRGTGTGPLSLAAHLLGQQNLLIKLAEMSRGRATAEDEQDYATLMNVASDTAIAFLNAQTRAGQHIAYLGDSLASCDMISPETYREYVLPYHRHIFEALRDTCRRYGAHAMLHICGDDTAILKDLAATGTEIYEVDSKISLREAKRQIGDDVCLIGNLDPAGALMSGNPADVQREAEVCISEAARGSGFILGTGCFVAWETPLENLQAMVRASHEYRA